MDVSIVGPKFPLDDFLERELVDAISLRSATAYLSRGGLSVIQQPVEEMLRHDGTVSFVHGIDPRVTHPDAIRLLCNWNIQYNNMTYRVHVGSHYNAPKFHPKVYISSRDDVNYTAVIGSANLTKYGLRENYEISSILKGRKDEPEIKQTNQVFDRLIDDIDFHEPGAEFLKLYEEIFARKSRVENELESADEFAALWRELHQLQPQSQVWTPKTQTDFVVKALQNLESRKGPIEGIALREIIQESNQLARQSGREFFWNTWDNSIRRVLNTNTLGKPNGKRLFQRIGGEDSRSGIYLLSDLGRAYRGT